MLRLTHLIVLAAFILSCGGQWYLLQGVAWIKMIHDYSQMVPLGEAVSMTFSGQYPCALCKAIAEKQAAENDQLLTIEKFKKQQIATASIAVPPRNVATFSYPDFGPSLRFRSEPPPTPPPRLALS
ncbi:MAG TPA: hypothetical protein VGC39_04365 [Candidatus Methylacidiphilales bacterium]